MCQVHSQCETTNYWLFLSNYIDSPRQVRATIVTKGEFHDLLELTLCNESSFSLVDQEIQFGTKKFIIAMN